jgi:poly-gamma-glutamate capsule biosynthesis protein CapA/YwtB (metallophosphatase superfamily)
MLNSKNYAAFPGTDFRFDDARMRLANTVTGNETPLQLSVMGALDTRFALGQANTDIFFQIQSAQFDQANARFKQDQKQKTNLFNMGAIFA